MDAELSLGHQLVAEKKHYRAPTHPHGYGYVFSQPNETPNAELSLPGACIRNLTRWVIFGCYLPLLALSIPFGFYIAVWAPSILY